MLLGAEARDRQRLHQADRQVLAVIVEQHQALDLVGHVDQQFIALFQGELALLDGSVQQDLDVDLVIGGVDAGRVVDEVGVEQAAGLGKLDAPALGETQISTFADDPAAQLPAIDAQRVVAAIAAFAVAFRGGLDIDADAAVPEQLRRCLENGAHQLVRRQLLHPLVHAQGQTHFRGDGDGLGAARKHAATGADQAGVVIGPGRARQREHALAFHVTGFCVGIRIDEDMAVVEGGQQSDLA